ncbi:MAG: putative oxidoreductase, large subunit [Amycolatopsis sp.]|uniref:xanthine dehydrogenase family protein molybdopterin-binding subunit n=1 Tax=Amycolatopsis sp. TaxID=37632 RepID=UPI00262B8C73|nr:xanthine dehydrogenase family protein molybdopterin-binding subunit [Amycolatopsis sp.]MCU1680830.1 putative oxidoreductase, large subunit [Amycolatopsis sp.]
MTTTANATSPVGAVRTRVEGRAKVTGAALYAADVPYADLVHGWAVLSTIPHGRVHTVSTAAVESMPGVVGVLHHGNAPRLNPTAGWGAPDGTLQILQDDQVPHAGWPVALVLADTLEQARAGAEALVVAYDEEPFGVTFAHDHPGLRTATESPLAPPLSAEHGDVEQELVTSAVVVDQLYTTPGEHHVAIEPHAATARWADGRLELVDANQGSFLTARILADLFFLDPDSVRVRSEHVGGGFGSKALVRPQAVLAAMAATVFRRTVRVVLSRRQVFTLTGYRSPTAQRIRLGADRDGRLRAIDHQSSSQTSTVLEFVEPAGAMTRVMYGSDALRVKHKVVRLNVPSPRWMRAPGEAPGSFALESAMDELAVACGLDPIELRVRNEPTVAPGSGLPFTSRNLVACFREGAQRFGWATRDPRSGIRRDGRWLMGTGMAAGSYPGDTSFATATATAEPDGGFTVRVAAADIGQGARTALTQIAAQALEVGTDRVRLLIADSDFGPAILAGHSWGTASWGLAVTRAATSLRKTIADLPSIPATGISVKVDTAKEVEAMGHPERHAYAAQFAEVAVDVSTGEVRVRRLLGTFAIGRVVNPLTVSSQLIGGMTWGLSMALHEAGVMDPAFGTQVNADLAGYHIATHADVPPIEVSWVDDEDLHNPTGIKGAGEIGIVGTAAAIANAVWHATGVRHRALPITPDRVLGRGIS